MNEPDQQVQVVGVAGLGVMGQGIVACFLSHGYRVIAHDPDAGARSRAREYVQLAIGELVERAGFPESLRDAWPDRLTESDSPDAFAACDFVVETIVEKESAKKEFFRQLESIVRPEIPLASNTSAIPISLLQQGRLHPERIIGMHWLQPCQLTRFLEIIRGEKTSDATLACTEALAWRLGKEPAILNRDVRGFIINRLGYALFREALYLVEQGVADPETIERAWCNSAGWYAGIAGPFRIMDHNLTVYATVMQELLPELSDAKTVPPPLKELVDAGETGYKTGQGFYSYGPGDVDAWEGRFRDFMWDMRALVEKYRPLDREKKE